MAIIKIILLAIAFVTLAMLGLATRILLKKDGKFPNTHVGGNKYLRKQGIACATTQDKVEQAKAKKEMQFKNLKLADNEVA